MSLNIQQKKYRYIMLLLCMGYYNNRALE